MSKIAGEEVSQQNLDARGLQLYFGSVILALAVMAVKHYFFGGWYVWQANLALLLIFTLGFIFALSTDAHDESWGSGVDWRSFYGTLLIFPAELLFAAIMVPIAVKFRSAMVFGCGAALFLLGMVSQFLGTKFLGSGAISVALKSLIPNWQIFWISDLLGQRDELLVSQVSSYALHCFIHSLSYIVCCVIVATIIFNRRELYGQDTT